MHALPIATLLAAQLASETPAPIPTATSYAEAVAAGMAILFFICGGVWFVIKLMNDPIKEKLVETAKRAEDAKLELAGLKKDVDNHTEKTEKLENDLKESIKAVTNTVEKIDAKLDALMQRA